MIGSLQAKGWSPSSKLLLSRQDFQHWDDLPDASLSRSSDTEVLALRSIVAGAEKCRVLEAAAAFAAAKFVVGRDLAIHILTLHFWDLHLAHAKSLHFALCTHLANLWLIQDARLYGCSAAFFLLLRRC